MHKKIIIAPNAYKGSLSSVEAAQAIANGFLQSGADVSLVQLPIADGGDGSLPVILEYFGGEILEDRVKGPLGEDVFAKWGYSSSSHQAIIELAEASGIRLVATKDLDPMRATTYGTGQLIEKANRKGAREIFLTIGGSATNDMGLGALEALGFRFYKGNQQIMAIKPMDFLSVTSIISPEKEFPVIKILCDVTNPLIGDQGASSVFGPQKGAIPEDIEILEKSFVHIAGIIEREFRKDITKVAGGGAAGGIAAVLYGALDAEIIQGGEQILEWADFDQQLEGAYLLITGEGKIDEQTNYGKGPGLVARKAKEKGIKVIGLSGILDSDTSKIECFDQLIQISSSSMTIEESMKRTKENLEKAAYDLGCGLKDS